MTVESFWEYQGARICNCRTSISESNIVFLKYINEAVVHFEVKCFVRLYHSQNIVQHWKVHTRRRKINPMPQFFLSFRITSHFKDNSQLGKSRKWQAHMLYSIHTHFPTYQTKCILDLPFFLSFKYIFVCNPKNRNS